MRKCYEDLDRQMGFKGEFGLGTPHKDYNVLEKKINKITGEEQ